MSLISSQFISPAGPTEKWKGLTINLNHLSPSNRASKDHGRVTGRENEVSVAGYAATKLFNISLSVTLRRIYIHLYTRRTNTQLSGFQAIVTAWLSAKMQCIGILIISAFSWRSYFNKFTETQNLPTRVSISETQGPGQSWGISFEVETEAVAAPTAQHKNRASLCSESNAVNIFINCIYRITLKQQFKAGMEQLEPTRMSCCTFSCPAIPAIFLGRSRVREEGQADKDTVRNTWQVTKGRL